jgi:hypothetical protein
MKPNVFMHLLNNLHSYCRRWQLTININKTKVIIFNEGGHHITKHNFFLGDLKVEITQSYCYLGIIFSASGNFNLALQNLHDKALKAFHHFKQFDFRNNIKMALKLFDTLVTPILNYGCEAWAPFAFKTLNDSNFLHLSNKPIIEDINIKLCKYLLGVHRKACNLAVTGELGRFPLIIDAFSLCFKNWQRVCNLNTDSIVKKSYLDSLFSDTKSVNTWTASLHTFMVTFNLSHLWENQGLDTYQPSLKFILQSKYKTDWLTSLNSVTQKKLRTYRTFKHNFAMEH